MVDEKGVLLGDCLTLWRICGGGTWSRWWRRLKLHILWF